MHKVMYVKSDNYDGLVTKDAYKEIRLLMSTGDFHSHVAEERIVNDLEGVYTYENLQFDLFDEDSYGVFFFN